MSFDDAWAAGFVDGEGYLQLQPVWPKRAGDNWKPRIEVAQTDPAPIHKLHQLYGGTVLKLKRRSNRRQTWRWDLCGAAVEIALMSMLPFMVVKRRQAEILLEYTLRVIGNSGRLTNIEREIRRGLAQQLLTERQEKDDGM